MRVTFYKENQAELFCADFGTQVVVVVVLQAVVVGPSKSLPLVLW